MADQLADGGTRLDAWSAETDGAEVTVRCTRYVDIAFGWLFLGGRAAGAHGHRERARPDACPDVHGDGPRPGEVGGRRTGRGG